MDDVRGLFLGMPHGTTPAAVTTNKNIIMSSFKDLNSKVAKRGSVFIGVMTPDGAILFKYQRAVLMR